MTATTKRYTKATRNAVAKASDGLPDLGTWLNRIQAINDPTLTESIEGIWCGRTGNVVLALPGYNSMLCMGWYNGRVEWSYLS